jgi:hypothetical protein
MRSALLTLVFVALATPALAVDGVVEINQTCAVQTGCFREDAPGFPVTITGTAGKSYRLTGDLRVSFTFPASDGLLIDSEAVVIDFNGFTMFGAVIGSSTGNGIVGGGNDGSLAGHATIKNGSMTGWRE